MFRKRREAAGVESGEVSSLLASDKYAQRSLSSNR